MKNVLQQVLSALNIHPVLVDVGSSAEPPHIWHDIAKQSIYVGFDPDLRDLREVGDDRFHQAVIVNKAIISDETAAEVLFYFTQSPYCSSILPPDMASLANFIFADRFTVTGTSTVQATSLNKVVARLNLHGIDWLKVDTQGTDLRIFNSLHSDMRSRVLAVDIEPGLVNGYVGEDLFVDSHKDLVANGFWLSMFNAYGSVRMKRTTVNGMLDQYRWFPQGLSGRCIRNTPAWCEARYLRSTEWLNQTGASRRDYVVLWIFALIDSQIGFALDVVMEYERLFGKDKIAEMMRNESIAVIKRRMPLAVVIRSAQSGIKRILPVRMRRFFSNLM